MMVNELVDVNSMKTVIYNGETTNFFIYYGTDIIDKDTGLKVNNIKLRYTTLPITKQLIEQILFETYIENNFKETAEHKYMRYNDIINKRYVMYLGKDCLLDFKQHKIILSCCANETFYYKCDEGLIPKAQILAETFLMKPKGAIARFEGITFIDGNRMNCDIDNLEWKKITITDTMKEIWYNGFKYPGYYIDKTTGIVYDAAGIETTKIYSEGTHTEVIVSKVNINTILADTFVFQGFKETDTKKFLIENGVVNTDYIVDLEQEGIFSRSDNKYLEKNNKGEVKIKTIDNSRTVKDYPEIDLILDTFVNNCNRQIFKSFAWKIQNGSLYDLTNIDFKYTALGDRMSHLSMSDCRTILYYVYFYKMPTEVIDKCYNVSATWLKSLIDNLPFELMVLPKYRLVKGTKYTVDDVNNILYLHRKCNYKLNTLATLYNDTEETIVKILKRQDEFASCSVWDKIPLTESKIKDVPTSVLTQKDKVLIEQNTNYQVKDIKSNIEAEHDTEVQYTKEYLREKYKIIHNTRGFFKPYIDEIFYERYIEGKSPKEIALLFLDDDEHKIYESRYTDYRRWTILSEYLRNLASQIGNILSRNSYKKVKVKSVKLNRGKYIQDEVIETKYRQNRKRITPVNTKETTHQVTFEDIEKEKGIELTSQKEQIQVNTASTSNEQTEGDIQEANIRKIFKDFNITTDKAVSIVINNIFDYYFNKYYTQEEIIKARVYPNAKDTAQRLRFNSLLSSSDLSAILNEKVFCDIDKPSVSDLSVEDRKNFIKAVKKTAYQLSKLDAVDINTIFQAYKENIPLTVIATYYQIHVRDVINVLRRKNFANCKIVVKTNGMDFSDKVFNRKRLDVSRVITEDDLSRVEDIEESRRNVG